MHMLRLSRTMAGLPSRNRDLREMEPHGHTTSQRKQRRKILPIQSPAWPTHWQNPTAEDTSGTGSLGNTVLRCQLWDSGHGRSRMDLRASRQLWSPFHISQFGSPVFHYFVSYCVQSSIFSMVKYALWHNLPFNHLKTVFTSVATS